MIAVQDSLTILHEGCYREELTYWHAASSELALPLQVLPVLGEGAILVLNPHQQAGHVLVVQVALRRELLLCLEHRMEVARHSEDGVSEQRIALASALLVV